MSSIELKNVEGGAAGTVELNSDVFGIVIRCRGRAER